MSGWPSNLMPGSDATLSINLHLRSNSYLACRPADITWQTHHRAREAERGWVRLVERMLAIEKGERPVAGRVLRGLRCVAIRKVAEPIEVQLRSSPAEEEGGEGVEEGSSRRLMRLEYAVETGVFGVAGED